MGIHKFLQKHRKMNSIERRTGSGRPTKMTAAVKALVEWQMRDDHETSPSVVITTALYSKTATERGQPLIHNAVIALAKELRIADRKTCVIALVSCEIMLCTFS